MQDIKYRQKTTTNTNGITEKITNDYESEMERQAVSIT